MEETYVAAGAGLAIGFVLVLVALSLALALFYGYCLGRIFQKAGRPLWTGFIPIYNVYIWIEIVGRPTWWIILMLIPVVSTVIQCIISIDLARSFGRDEVFGVLLLWILSFIGIPILAFNDDRYVGPSVERPNALAQP